MTFAVVHSRALAGANAPPVEVETHLANGLPQFNIVGLPDTEVKESRDRVRAAIIQSGFEFPAKKITVNLAPADLPKESGRFDLPVALGILAASGQISPEQLPQYEFAGELALSGLLRPIRGGLAMAWQAKQARRAFVMPSENAAQAAVMHGVEAYGADSLATVAAHLNGTVPLPRAQAQIRPSENQNLPDLKDVKGQHTARLALEIAAAGGHSLLMMGPPGTGKSMLAQRLPSILPPLTDDELIEVWTVQSLLPHHTQNFSRSRPCKSPHHSASAVALVGGGSDPRPGEISLAHKGVLFLDELPEFDRKVLEALREPLESGEIHISRAARQAVFPADFQLVAAMNPCPCGYHGHPSKPCRCTPVTAAKSQARLSTASTSSSKCPPSPLPTSCRPRRANPARPCSNASLPPANAKTRGRASSTAPSAPPSWTPPPAYPPKPGKPSAAYWKNSPSPPAASTASCAPPAPSPTFPATTQ